MSISSTGLYGSATIVNSDLFTDVETQAVDERRELSNCLSPHRILQTAAMPHSTRSCLG